MKKLTNLEVDAFCQDIRQGFIEKKKKIIKERDEKIIKEFNKTPLGKLLKKVEEFDSTLINSYSLGKHIFKDVPKNKPTIPSIEELVRVTVILLIEQEKFENIEVLRRTVIKKYKI